MKVVIKDAGRGYDDLIFGAWLDCKIYQGGYPPGQPRRCFADRLRSKIACVLEQDGTRVVVACEPGSDDALGYAVFSGPHVYFLYVKREWRRRGLGTFIVSWIKEQSLQQLTFATMTHAMKYMARRWDVNVDEEILEAV